MSGLDLDDEDEEDESGDRSDGEDEDDADENPSPPLQQRSHLTPFFHEPDPGAPKRMRRLRRIFTAIKSKTASSNDAATEPGNDSNPSATLTYDFPVGFSNIHLDLAVAAVGGTGTLATPKASVSIAISEIDVASDASSGTASMGSDMTSFVEINGGDPEDDEPPGAKRRAVVVFTMWCHATRIAEHEEDPQRTRAAGRPRIHVKHIRDEAIKMHRHNAKLLRAAAKKRCAVTYYDEADAAQTLMNMAPLRRAQSRDDLELPLGRADGDCSATMTCLLLLVPGHFSQHAPFFPAFASSTEAKTLRGYAYACKFKVPSPESLDYRNTLLRHVKSTTLTLTISVRRVARPLRRKSKTETY
ncbi:hypothetical protein H9P43_007258, partial [Blastocladiella emersonii ATCC 22665]